MLISSRIFETLERLEHVYCISSFTRSLPGDELMTSEIFEIASGPGLTDKQRRDILQIRVVGGGPTGVEFAAEVHDFVKSDVERLYPQLKGLIEVTLYDVAPGILMSFDA
jgi:NADH dehydrogenase FAD-containing subunit